MCFLRKAFVGQGGEDVKRGFLHQVARAKLVIFEILAAYFGRFEKGIYYPGGYRDGMKIWRVESELGWIFGLRPTL